MWDIMYVQYKYVHLVKGKYQETTNNLKQLSCLTISLNLISYS